MKNLFFLLFVSTIVTSKMMGQEFDIFLRDIEEIRSDFYADDVKSKTRAVNQLKILTAVNGIILDKNHLVKLEDIKVVDDKGKVLPLIDNSNNDKYTSNKSQEIVLEIPRRKCKSITITGSLMYFTPNKENKAYIRIDDFVGRSGVNLIGDQHNEAELIVLAPAEVLKLEEEINKLITKELEDNREVLSDQEVLEIEFSRKILKNIVQRGTDEQVHFINLKLNPSPKKFYSINVYNYKDQVISYNSSSVENLYQIILSEKPTAGSYIELVMENGTAVKRFDFSLENVLLP